MSKEIEKKIKKNIFKIFEKSLDKIDDVKIQYVASGKLKVAKLLIKSCQFLSL